MPYPLLVPRMLKVGRGVRTEGPRTHLGKRPFDERAIVRELLAELQTAWGGAV